MMLAEEDALEAEGLDALVLDVKVGSGAIFLRKKPARSSVVIDADAAVAARWAVPKNSMK